MTNSFENALTGAMEGETVKDLSTPTKKANDMGAFGNALAGAMENETYKDLKKPTPVAKDKSAFQSALSKAMEAPKPEAIQVVDVTELGQVSKWSFSSLSNFEKCPYITKLQYIDGQKQKDSPAAKRGSEAHDMCEEYVRGNIPELKPDRKMKLDPLKPKFESLRAAFGEGRVSCEENWGIRLDWSPCTWEDDELWGRGKLDAFVVSTDGKSARVIDYKTGRRFGNELKHGDQGLSYALHAYYRYPDIDTFYVEFWYLDQGESTQRMFTRKQLALLHPRYHKRALAMTTETQFRPKPSQESCRFCPYGRNTNKQGQAYGMGICTFDHYNGLSDKM